MIALTRPGQSIAEARAKALKALLDDIDHQSKTEPERGLWDYYSPGGWAGEVLRDMLRELQSE